MKSLSHPTRLLTLCQLADGELAVGELAARLGCPQPAMSRQLALLRREGLVSTRRDGQNVFYRLPPGKVASLVRYLYRAFCD